MINMELTSQEKYLRKIRQEVHEQALARLRNLKSKNKDRQIAQKLYDSLVELRGLISFYGFDSKFDKYENKGRMKMLFRRCEKAMQDANKNGYSHAKTIKKEFRM